MRNQVVATMCTVGLLAATALVGCTPDSAEQTSVGQAPGSVTMQALRVSMDLPTSIASAEVIVMGRVDGQQWTSRGVELSKDERDAHVTSLREAGCSDAEIRDALAASDRFSSDIVYTHSSFLIERTLKGDISEKRIQVSFMGGEYEGWQMNCDGPKIRPGQRYIVFLGHTPGVGYVPVAVYTVDKGRARTSDEGRQDDIALEELLALIEEYDDAQPDVVDPTESLPDTAPPAVSVESTKPAP